MLKDRDLESSSKKSLYLYQLNENEYLELKNLLKKQGKMFFFSSVLYQCDAAFTLFVSEWYRREYDGSIGWSWQGIWNELGYELNSTEIEQVVINGLEKYWKRPIRRDDRGRNFLGSLFSEGGLPFKLLQKEGNSFSVALRSVLSIYQHRNQLGKSTEQLVEQKVGTFPQTFQNNETIRLISELIDRLMVFVKRYDLDQHSYPSKYLDFNDPDWRESFPIPLDKATGSALLDGWLSDASIESKRLKKPIKEFSLFHCLSDFNEIFKIDINLFLPEKIILEIDCNSLSSARLNTSLWEGGVLLSDLGAAYLQIDETYSYIKLRKKSIKTHRFCLEKSVRLVVQDSGKIIYEKYIKNSDIPVYDEPLIFSKKDDEWIFLGSGSARIKASKARVFIADSMEFECLDDEYDLLYEDENIGGWYLEIWGNFTCYLKSDRSIFYNVLLNSSADDIVSFNFDGRVVLWGSVPNLIYLGRPKLIGDNCNLYELWNGEKNNILTYGVMNYTLRKNSSNEVVVRRRFGILPNDFDVKFVAGETVRDASIVFYGINGFSIDLKNNSEVDGEMVCHDNCRIIILKCSSHVPPKNIEVEIVAPNSTSLIVLTLPFPAVGVIVFDASGRKLNKKSLTVSDLLGSRLHMMAQTNKSEKFKIELSLKSQSYKNSPAENMVCTVADKPDIRSLYDFKGQINDLFSLSSELDSVVEMSIIRNGQLEEQLDIRRYGERLMINKESGTVSIESRQEAVEVMAMLLHKPEQSSRKLPEKLSEGIGVGCFYTSPSLDHEGPWLLYSSEQSSIQFRPRVFWGVDSTVLELEPAASSLYQAVKLFHPKKNPDVIDDQIENMINDFDHSGWGYLNTLLEKYSHLPMPTFEVWQAITKNEKALAALMFRLEWDVEWITKLELELSVIWEKVTLESWLTAKRNFRSWFIQSGFSEEIAQKSVDEKIEETLDYCRGLEHVSVYLKHEDSSWLAKFPHGALDSMITGWYQELRQTHSEDIQWPTYLKESLYYWSKKNEKLSFFRSLSKTDWDSSVILFPCFMAAITAGESSFEELFFDKSDVEINYQIKKLRDFDRKWFYSTYSVLLSTLYIK